jgi:hypothetical protein
MDQKELWELQHIINDNNTKQFEVLSECVKSLLSIVEDHELRIMTMTKEINKLKERLSNYEES